MLAQPWWGASMIEYTSAESPAIDSSAPTGSSRACSGSLERGTQQPRRRPARRAMIGTLTKNTAPQEKCSRRKPLAIGPRAAPAPEMPAQMAMALCPLLRREDVGEDRQGGGHDEGGAEAHHGSSDDDALGGVEEGREEAAGEEHEQPDLQRALAAVPVADGAGGEQEPGEHQGVGVDHPLELRAGGIELAGQRGQRHVEAGVAHDDDDQAGAEHRQRPPAPAVDVLVDREPVVTGRPTSSCLPEVSKHGTERAGGSGNCSTAVAAGGRSARRAVAGGRTAR